MNNTRMQFRTMRTSSAAVNVRKFAPPRGKLATQVPEARLFFRPMRIGDRDEPGQIRDDPGVRSAELFEWVCAVSSTHRYDRVSNLLSGRQTTHAAQRTAKSTLTYELGTGEEVPSSPAPFCFSPPTSRWRKSKRTVYGLRSWLSATFSPSFNIGSRVIRPLFHRTSHP